jgi:hypothetical protein
MDPYLEGYLWPDVHHRLATQISRQLAPKIQPNYVARLEISVIEDESFTAEVGLMYPDVEVLKINSLDGDQIDRQNLFNIMVIPYTLYLL